jgi:hypothetical protein
MDHPLIANIDHHTPDELLEKVTELQKKLSIAYRIGNNDLCNQIRMALETYQNKYNEKSRKTDSDTGFDDIIDIS